LSAPIAEYSTLIPLAVIGASLFGSAHCVGMCGGLVVATARTRAGVISYHLGRLAGYLALGALAGRIGEATFGAGDSGIQRWLGWGATGLLAAGFIAMGVRVWQGRGAHLFRTPSQGLERLFRFAAGRPGWTGLLSAFLPCGWLHSFVLAAVATGSAARGAALLGAFWLGTVPALALTPWLSARVLRPVAMRVPRLCAILLIAAGALSLGIRVAAAFGGKPACHCVHSD
jgi:sulfite exporter TauE/SafE